MPLVRFEVRNEYSLADPELYNGPHEDPRPAFEGLAVAGLVGILRQLGDLAEFAADVFRDLHEQVMITGARGQKILSRVQKIESALLPLEKAVQNQRSHIHFAYIAGCDWHPDVRTGQSRLICSELPQYMIDSYEECRDPPRLYLLDNFDNAGPGACLRRYSDPSYFRRALTASEPVKPEKVKRRKKKGSRLRSRDVQQVLTPRESSSTQFESPSTDQLSFSVENISITDGRPKSECERESTSFDSETIVNFEDTNTSFMVHDELEHNVSSISTSIINPSDACVPVLHNEPIEDMADDDSQHDSLQQQTVLSSCSVTWDEKTEIVKPKNPKMCEEVLVDKVEDAESLPLSFKTSNLGHENAKLEESSQEFIIFDIGNLPGSLSGGTHFDEVTSETENYMDANNILESEIEMGGECQTKQEVKSLRNLSYANLKPELSELEGRTISSLDGFDGLDSAASCSSTNDYISPRLSDFILSECLEHDQSICATGFAPKHDSVGSDYSRSYISNVSGVNGSKGLNDDLFQEIKSLSDLCYADSKLELSNLEGRTVSSFDGFDGLAPTASCSATNDYISPTLPNFIPSEGLERDQSIVTSGFAANHDSVGSDHSGNHISSVSGVNGSDGLNDDLFQEVKSLPNFNYADSEPELSELEGKTLSSLDDFDGLAPAGSCSSTNDSLSPRLSNLIPLEDLECDQSICTTGFAPDSVSSDYSGSHISNVSGANGSKGVNGDLSTESNTVNEHLELVEDTKAKIINPQDPTAASLQVPSLNCWTNGGIFGVEPSKPPDFSILCDTVATSETFVMSREITFAEESTKSQPVKQNAQESSQGPSLGEHVKNGEVPVDGTYAHNHGLDKKETNATALGSNLLRCATIGSQFNSCDQGISASISDLAQRFLANNLQRRISVNHTDISTMSHSVNADFRKSPEISLQNEHQALSNGLLSRVLRGLDKERMVVGSSVHSLSASSPKTGASSPPLEHMKLSFHPMNGLQTTKLKLEFSGGDVHESNGDLTFPSFQLIPGPSTASLDSGSESDDDTFCRSSYSSQCLFSPHSASNSELWGEEETSGTQEHEISDNSCRVSSSTTSICSSLDSEKMDRCSIYPAPESENLELERGLVPIGFDPTRDLPGIDSVIFTRKQEQEICDLLTNDPIYSKPLSLNELPLPPPLLPMQWQVVQPSSSLEDKNSSSEQLDAHTQSSVTLEQQEKDAPRWPCNTEGVAPPSKKTHDQQNLNGHRELNSNYNSEEPDEREDLLQQIRSKNQQSFDLRPTVTLQLNQTPGPATNVNVVATLEKADVIHQTFVSNNKGGEDDIWSKG